MRFLYPGFGWKKSDKYFIQHHSDAYKDPTPDLKLRRPGLKLNAPVALPGHLLLARLMLKHSTQ